MTKWAYASSTVKIKIKNRILIEEKEKTSWEGYAWWEKTWVYFWRPYPAKSPFTYSIGIPKFNIMSIDYIYPMIIY